MGAATNRSASCDALDFDPQTPGHPGNTGVSPTTPRIGDEFQGRLGWAMPLPQARRQ